MLGAKGNEIFSRAYTDGGGEHVFEMQSEGDRLIFPDRVPACARSGADGARKMIQPTQDGYRETLELIYGDRYEVSYTVEFTRLS